MLSAAAGVQRGEHFEERLLAFADGRQVDRFLFQHPAVVGGDLGPAQKYLDLRPRGLQFPGDPDRPLDVPEIASKADDRRPAGEDGLDQSAIAQPVGKPRGKNIDRPAREPIPLGKELQVGGGERHIALDRLRSRRRDRQLDEQGALGVGSVFIILCIVTRIASRFGAGVEMRPASAIFIAWGASRSSL